ncbi:MAG: hypothetical protein M1825_002007 [Sarcosagium campestre]|nr:MAG: hypothetical protein M1825_002007 [Sarcosagium campestre]
MIVIEEPINMHTLRQSIARTYRLGQRQEQRVWVLFMDHTYDRILSANVAEKGVSDMAAQIGKNYPPGGVPADINERAERALCFSMGWSRYPESQPSPAYYFLSMSLLLQCQGWPGQDAISPALAAKRLFRNLCNALFEPFINGEHFGLCTDAIRSPGLKTLVPSVSPLSDAFIYGRPYKDFPLVGDVDRLRSTGRSADRIARAEKELITVLKTYEAVIIADTKAQNKLAPPTDRNAVDQAQVMLARCAQAYVRLYAINGLTCVRYENLYPNSARFSPFLRRVGAETKAHLRTLHNIRDMTRYARMLEKRASTCQMTCGKGRVEEVERVQDVEEVEEVKAVDNDGDDEDASVDVDDDDDTHNNNDHDGAGVLHSLEQRRCDAEGKRLIALDEQPKLLPISLWDWAPSRKDGDVLRAFWHRRSNDDYSDTHIATERKPEPYRLPVVKPDKATPEPRHVARPLDTPRKSQRRAAAATDVTTTRPKVTLVKRPRDETDGLVSASRSKEKSGGRREKRPKV